MYTKAPGPLEGPSDRSRSRTQHALGRSCTRSGSLRPVSSVRESGRNRTCSISGASFQASEFSGAAPPPSGALREVPAAALLPCAPHKGGRAFPRGSGHVFPAQLTQGTFPKRWLAGVNPRYLLRFKFSPDVFVHLFFESLPLWIKGGGSHLCFPSWGQALSASGDFGHHARCWL